jgi:hypothetical protein
MLRAIFACAALACALAGGLPKAVQARDNYYEWSTRHPFSGWVWGGGRHSYYCDYIRYPVRRCSRQKVCQGGRCWWTENCRVVGWDIRQTCY